MGYKTDTNQLADSMAHFRKQSMINYRSCTFFNPKQKHQDFLSILLLLLNVATQNLNPFPIGVDHWRLLGFYGIGPHETQSKSGRLKTETHVLREFGPMWQCDKKHDRLIIYLHVSPRISTCSSYISENHGAAAGNFRFNTSHPRSCPQPSLSHSFRF